MRFIGSFLTIISILIFPTISLAEPYCSQREAIAQKLAVEKGEFTVGVGFAVDGSQSVERFASLNGLTWTLVVDFPNKTSCIIGEGVYWKEIPSVFILNGVGPNND